MTEKIAHTYTESLQEMVSRYRKSGQKWPATSRDIARWSYRNKLWEPQEKNIVGQLARDLSRAMREECYTDPQGRRVRTKHAARRVEDALSDDAQDAVPTQKMLWHDIRTDDGDHIIMALQQRRMQIVGDCSHLKVDGDSFNDNHSSGKKIQRIFNLEDDMADMDQPTEYIHPGSSSDDLD